MKFVQQYGTLLEKEAEEMRPIVDDDLEKYCIHWMRKNLHLYFGINSLMLL